LAGTPADLQQAEQLKQTWLEQGLDRVDILGYDVLLSYPKDGDPNIISLVKGECVISLPPPLYCYIIYNQCSAIKE